MIPGSNLLKAALGIIARQTLTYYEYAGRTRSASGKYVSSYEAPVSISGSFQPMQDAALLRQYGLDFNATYFTLYTSTPVIIVGRDVAGDQLLFNNKQYQCEVTTDWHAIDGWNEIVCVEVPKTLG